MTLDNTGMIIARGRSWKKWLGIVSILAIVIGICVAIRNMGGGPERAGASQPQQAQTPVTPQTPQTRQKADGKAAVSKQAQSAPPGAAGKDNTKKLPPDIVAEVNGHKITRDDLAQECLLHYGKDIIDQMINRQLIIGECKRRNIKITQQEIDTEINRIATRFGIPLDQWYKLLKDERGISPEQYADDIIWPVLALRRLAGDKLMVGKDELRREYEIEYGQAVKARLIACKDEEKAKKLRAMAVAKPEDFGNLAKDYSEDMTSAASKGLIQPIRKYGNYDGIEKAAFNMTDGEISKVIPAGGQFVILKRESLIPARDEKLEQVSGRLEEIIRDRKMRKVSGEVFQELKDSAKLDIVWGDPARQKKTPSTAAVVNGETITIRALALECIDKHGTDALEATINRTLLQMECKKRGVTVTDKDMDEEIARTAALAVKPKADGSPDVEAWLAQVDKEEGLSRELYRRDVVWPSAALRKLAGEKVDLTEEDLKKGFEANYGAKVRCLAIVLNNQRRAQEVFEKARKNNTSENFGDLAAQYSIEPGSNALRGEVPPIRKNGGQPVLEKEAFSLKPGELSGLIQVGDKFILLRCEGYTESMGVKFADVRDEIRKELYEKKLRLKMAEYFEDLQDAASIHNYLTGANHVPKEIPKSLDKTYLPTVKPVPAKS